MAVMMSAQDLAFGYGGKAIGQGVNISVNSGEVMRLMGPNGCGKTTLFRTLLGLLPPLGGCLEMRGRPVQAYTRAEFARHVAYVPQAGSSYFPFTVLNVVMMARASRIGTFATPSAHDRTLSFAALDRLGLSHLAERSFNEISGGERQMTLIARALVQEAELIVMDEPTASLDFGNQARVLDCINELRGSGLSIVLSTHDPGHAFACADRAVLMKQGRVVADGSPSEAVTPESLHGLYGVEVAVEFMQGAGRSICAPALGRFRQE
jgi:iron complex transport system ATP-binding protein